MDHISEFVDERQKGWCIHCARALAGLESSRDHVPTKTLLRLPYPANLPVVEVCTPCNKGFSLDEQYFVAFLGAVLAGSTEPGTGMISPSARILSENEKLRARIERSRSETPTHEGRTIITWTPEVERVNRVLVKNARGHAFFEYGEPMLREASHVWAAPLQSLSTVERQCFEDVANEQGVYPEVGSRMMTRVLTGKDLRNSWVVVQEEVYRFAIIQLGDGLCIRSVMYEYLAAEVYLPA